MTLRSLARLRPEWAAALLSGGIPRSPCATTLSPLLCSRAYTPATGAMAGTERKAMLYELERDQRKAAEQAVPWFLSNMPDDYFDNVPRELQMRHLQAVTALSHSGALPELTLADEDQVTLLMPESQNLAGLLQRYRLSGFKKSGDVMRRKLTSVQVFSSKDGSLNLDIFRFQPQASAAAAQDACEFEECSGLFDQVAGTEDTLVQWHAHDTDATRATVFIATANVIKTLALMRASQVVMIKLEVTLGAARPPRNGTPFLPLPPPEEVVLELGRTIKWANDDDLAFVQRHPSLTLMQAEVIHALAELQHTRLGLQRPYSFTMTNVMQIIESPLSLPYAVAIADLFMRRFDPTNPLSNAAFAAEATPLAKAMQRSSSDQRQLALLTGMLEAVEAVKRTNLYLPKRYGLAMRLDPSHLGHGTVGSDMPYGTYYVYGRRFKAFQVRFRDISRGGLRVVTPKTREQHAAESTRTYNEAYSLAYAQQLKNKDIPEGGAKATILLKPDESDEYIPELFGPSFMIRKVVRAFTDCILDLTTNDPRVVDLLGRDELVYLGPDENIIPQDIEWIVQRAEQRKYMLPQALMSSKPTNGINHKQYGVTSEGVAVYLDVGLRETGRHPAQTGRPFTVKLTGGTDGDVAGNMLRIMHERYGDDVKVLGLADGGACLEDPDGLHAGELQRLVSSALPLSAFNRARLGPHGTLTLTDTMEGARRRDTMHSRVLADVFVPAGGRPGTINERNYHEYLSAPGGLASSPLVVEGANLFITPEARQALFSEAGVVIVKDSSANKCGVITSSYEILASMLLSPEEFLNIKSKLVPDVLTQLKRLAAVEAKLLFREARADPTTPIPKHSERVSRCVMILHDAITQTLESDVPIKDGKPDWEHVLVPAFRGGGASLTLGEVLDLVAAEHMPKSLLEAVGVGALRERVPWPYIQNIIAARLSTALTYAEGLTYVEALPKKDAARLAAVALQYLVLSRRLETLVGRVQSSSLQDKDDIIALLRKAGRTGALAD